MSPLDPEFEAKAAQVRKEEQDRVDVELRNADFLFADDMVLLLTLQ